MDMRAFIASFRARVTYLFALVGVVAAKVKSLVMRWYAICCSWFMLVL